MNRIATLTVSLGLTMLVGCMSSGKSIHVKGPTGDVVRLAGEWEGSYEGKQSQRVGTIVFDLGAGRHSADGEVYMYTSSDKTGTPTTLKIRFVSVSENQVSGKIAPYKDPRCNCMVQTEFKGEISGNVIDGTYQTDMGTTTASQTGHWSVYRKQ